MAVRRLLTRDTEPAQSGDADPFECLRVQAPDMSIDAAIHGRRGSQRHLLLEDDFDKCRKAGTPAPDGRIAQALVDSSEVGITRRQRTRALLEQSTCERARRDQFVNSCQAGLKTRRYFFAAAVSSARAPLRMLNIE